ncbi:MULTISPECIES: CxxxxCH/CxxCH domain-containing protein [Atopobiaceae]|uniref:CxxxxCH/CxxCH domain-containing protein n=1 Tax=Olsenella sp. KH1P3 TaxID=1945884 RepID=UPI0011776913
MFWLASSARWTCSSCYCHGFSGAEGSSCTRGPSLAPPWYSTRTTTRGPKFAC